MRFELFGLGPKKLVEVGEVGARKGKGVPSFPLLVGLSFVMAALVVGSRVLGA